MIVSHILSCVCCLIVSHILSCVPLNCLTLNHILSHVIGGRVEVLEVGQVARLVVNLVDALVLFDGTQTLQQRVPLAQKLRANLETLLVLTTERNAHLQGSLHLLHTHFRFAQRRMNRLHLFQRNRPDF